MCRAPKRKETVQSNYVRQEEDFSTGEQLALWSGASQLIQVLDFGERKVDFIIDTGSEVSIMPLKLVKEINKEINLKTCDMVVKGVTGHELEILGESTFTIKHDDNLIPIRFIITRSSPCILGLSDIRKLRETIVLHTELKSDFKTLLKQCGLNK